MPPHPYPQIRPEVVGNLVKVYVLAGECVFAELAGGIVGRILGTTKDTFQTASLLSFLGLSLFFMIPEKLETGSQRRAALLSFFFAASVCTLGPAFAKLSLLTVLLDFLGTMVTVVVLSVFSLVRGSQEWTALGNLLRPSLAILFLLNLVNLRLRHDILSFLDLHYGMGLWCGLVIYETQLLVCYLSQIGPCSTSNHDLLWQALLLVLDFEEILRRIIIFTYLLGNQSHRSEIKEGQYA